MGARQSKRSVDITTTPKKEGVPAEGVGDAAAPGDGKLERIEEADTKPTTNGIAPHTDTAEDKEKDKDEATEKDKELPQQDEVKAEETKPESSGDSPAEAAEVTTPTEATPASPNTTTSPDNKEAKKKDKKKKWSFRSISFSKKDKTKPSREDTPKNGDVTKEEPLAEGGEEAETAAASSPVEEKSSASSPSADEQVAAPVAAATESKEEAAAASPAAASPVEDKKEEPTPSAPTPVPSVEDKKEEAVEKVEAEKKVVEVSQSAGGQSVSDPVEVPVYRVQPVATPSIIERKTSEDLPSLPPSSPPPTPIDPSPLQQARQAAASATALAEALRLPAAVADEETTLASSSPLPDASLSSRENVPQESRAESAIITIPAVASSTIPDPSADLPPTTNLVFAEVESPSVVEIEITTSRDDVATEVAETLASNRCGKEVAIEPELESVSERSVTMMEEVSKSQEDKAMTAPEEKQLDVSLDSKDSQCDDIKKTNVECSFVPKEADPFVSTKGSDSVQDQFPVDNEESPAIVASSMVKQVFGVAMDKVMNDASPVVECPIESEINSREAAMKINVPSNAGHNEKVETGTLSSTEIETNGARCSAVRQHLSSENFDTEKVESSPNEKLQRAEKSDSNLLLEKCVVENSLSELKKRSATEVVEPPKIEAEVEKALTSPTEMFIDSEEGPLSVSEDILIEAKPAVVIPEDDSVDELTTESVKVIPDEERTDDESNTALPVEEIPIFEEPVDLSVPKNATAEPNAEVPDSSAKNELTVENTSPSFDASIDKENLEEIIAVSEELIACKNTQISLKEEQIALNEEQIALRETTLALIETAAPIVSDDELLVDLMNESTTIKEELAAIKEQLVANKEERIALQNEQIAMMEDEIALREKSLILEDESSIVDEEKPTPAATEQVTFLPQFAQTEELEKCPLSPINNRVSSPIEPCPLDRSSPELSDAPTCSLSEKHSSEPQTRVLSPESVPISFEDLPPAPEDTGAPSLDSFDYPLPPEELSCPLTIVIPPNASSEVELPRVAPRAKHAAGPKDTTETLLTPPVSPSIQSNVSIASGITTETVTNSQIPSYDEASLSEPNSYDQSDVNLTERLAAGRLAKTESQDGALSCQLSNTIPSTAAKEHHQKAPEAEAPVENNVAHDVSTTESVDEAPKVAPPAVPNEASASPPTAPAITEDVASVTKAIEEIDISDKAVAAAVNEAIECNTNEIIADAHHQNNINE